MNKIDWNSYQEWLIRISKLISLNLKNLTVTVFILIGACYCLSGGNFCSVSHSEVSEGYSALSGNGNLKYRLCPEKNCYQVKFEAKFFIGSQVEFDMPDDVKGRGIVRAIKIDDRGKIKYFILAEDNDSLIEFEEALLSSMRPMK